MYVTYRHFVRIFPHNKWLQLEYILTVSITINDEKLVGLNLSKSANESVWQIWILTDICSWQIKLGKNSTNSLWYMKLKSHLPSFHLHFWHADNSAVSLIEKALT